jgi:hypothetical protein
MTATFEFTWNATFLASPADTDEEAQGASQIRNTRYAVGERVEIDHSLYGDGNDGKHLYVTLRGSLQSPTAFGLDPGDGRLWAAPINSNSELLYQDSSGRVIQLTSAGGLNVAAEPIPGGNTAFMLFAQQVPPPGWTLSTAINDMLVRVVSGFGGDAGGSWTISGVTLGETTLSISQIPQHTHVQYYNADFPSGGNNLPQGNVAGAAQVPGTPSPSMVTGPVGGSAAHGHSWSNDGSWRPAYFDCIIASYD